MNAYIQVNMEIQKVFQEFGIDLEVTVASAHRTPELVKAFAEGARDRGVDVIISAAGAAAHLGGVVAAYTTLPVIGVPINATALNGWMPFEYGPDAKRNSCGSHGYRRGQERGYFCCRNPFP